MVEDSAGDKMFLEMSKQQGYVSPDCYLNGMVVWALVTQGEDPCAGCNLDRTICHGRPKRSVLNGYNNR
jgi:hypothetical protein